jgi:hypothetical protein
MTCLITPGATDHHRISGIHGSWLRDTISMINVRTAAAYRSMGPPQIQADGTQAEGWQGLTSAASPRKDTPLRSLVPVSWKRLNIGSGVNREVHARFWEQPEVQSLWLLARCALVRRTTR